MRARGWAVVAVVMVAAGCTRDESADDCARAATHVRAPDGTEEQQRAARAKIAGRCRADRWSGAMLDCLADARDKAACLRDQLTAQQWLALDTALDAFRPAPPAAEIDARLAALDKQTDAMCACRDIACVQRINDEMARLASAFDPRYRRALEGVAKTRAHELGVRLGACMQDVLAMSAGSETPSAAKRYVAKNAEFKAQLCACKDLPCGEAVAKQMTTWSEDFLRSIPESEHMSPDDVARMETLERDVQTCMRALRGAARP